LPSIDLTTAPEPLTQRQRVAFRALTLICAASRIPAISKSLWDWDEALFCLGMRSYDVSSHHPHPPGFPVYIAFGRFVRLFVHNDFRALQTINLIAAMLVFPALFLLARELRLGFVTSCIAGALCAFFPNVWFFGGTAFSDIPSIVLVVFAVVFLLRGCRDTESYLIGALLLALAAGIRPQNFVIGLAPGLIATWYRIRHSWRDVLFAALIGIVVVGVAFGGAMAATGSFHRYFSSVREHGEYISRVDSFRSPERPPLWHLFDRFFVKQYDYTPLSIIVTIFVVISIVAAFRDRNRGLLINFLTFAPFAVMAWLMLDRFSVSRFSIGYIPMFAIFAADGIARVSAGREKLAALLGAALTLSFAVWTFPALTSPRTTDAPSVLGVETVLRRIDPKRDDLFVAAAMVPFVQALAPKTPFITVQDDRALPLSIGARVPWLLAEIDSTHPLGYVFHRPKDHLWNIARRHYFDVALEPITRHPRFLSGWFGPERSGSDEWQWMSRHSTTILPPASGESVLRLKYDIPGELVAERPTITIALNGRTLDHFVVTKEASFEHDYKVTPAPGGAPNRLEMSIDKTYNAVKRHTGEDPRDLGIALRWLAWGPN